MSIRMGLSFALVMVFIAGLVPGASAQQEEEIEEFHRYHVSQQINLHADGTITATAPTGHIQVKSSGDDIETPPPPISTASNEQPGSFVCVNNRNRRKLDIYAPWKMNANDPNKLVWGFTWHPYGYNRARRVIGASGAEYASKQFLVCATGGSDGQEGWRILDSGPGTALENKRRSKRIGTRWGSGETPFSKTVTLGFEVGKGPIKISGTIEQEPRNVLRGNFTGPYRSAFEDYAINGLAGWWDANCSPCIRTSGSPDFQGNVASGLWEFRQNRKSRSFVIVPLITYYCSNPFGCG